MRSVDGTRALDGYKWNDNMSANMNPKLNTESPYYCLPFLLDERQDSVATD
jgi:hypothetical protein